MNELTDPETHEPGTEFESMYAPLEEEWNSLQLLKKSNEVRLWDALRKLLASTKDNVDDASAHVQNSVAFKDEAKQDTARRVMTAGASVDSKAGCTSHVSLDKAARTNANCNGTTGVNRAAWTARSLHLS
jgi:hypothetical protein